MSTHNGQRGEDMLERVYFWGRTVYFLGRTGDTIGVLLDELVEVDIRSMFYLLSK